MEKNIFNKQWDEINAIFENAAVILILVNKEGRIVHINKSGIEMINKNHSDIIGLVGGEVFNCINAWKDNELVCGKTENCEKCLIRTNVMSTFVNNTSKYKVEGIFEVFDKNNNKCLFHLLVSTSLIKVKDEEFVLLTIDDITKLKLQEFRLKLLNDTKNKLFSIIAHDLRNPALSLVGFSDLLIKDVQKKQFDKIEKYAQIIRETANNSFGLLSNLLDWSKNQIDGIVLKLEPIKLLSLSSYVIESCLTLSKNKEIEIICKIDEKIEIIADRNMLETIIRNLISNAIKFTLNKGKIILSATSNDIETIISVSDNGVGINSEKIAKIFQIGESSSTRGTNNEKGSGLGLILCKDFIEKHSGKIWVESEIEKGSTFYFTIPNYKIHET